jgi:peptide/nickel transport system substrate-binding protein
MFYSNKQIDELIDKGSKTVDDNKRAEMFGKCQEIIINDAPWIPPYVNEQISGHRSDLKGTRMLPMEVFLFNAAYIAK